MNYNKTKGFLKSLSKEVDGLVTKIGVIKIVTIIAIAIILNYFIVEYFNDFLSSFYIILVLGFAFFIISLEDSSKIKYLGVWIGSLFGVIFSIVVILIFIYGAGDYLIETIYGWFN